MAEELFNTEVLAYERLKPLQGTVVPICYSYGRARFRGARALILQDVGGISLFEPAGATLELEGLRHLLQECYHALHALGVHHDDPKLEHFRLVNGKLMVLDFERVAFDQSTEEHANLMAAHVDDLATQYQSIRPSLQNNGLLEAATVVNNLERQRARPNSSP